MRSLTASALSFLIAIASAAQPEQRPETRLKDLAMMVFNGKSDEAAPWLEAAVTTYHAESNAAGEGIALFLLGVADVARQKPVDVHPRFEKAAALLQQSGDTISAVIVIWAMSQTDKGQARMDDYKRALDLIAAASAPGAPFTLEGLKILAPAVGLDVGPMGMLPPEVMKPLLLQMMDVMIRDSLGDLLTSEGRLSEAEVELNHAAGEARIFGGMFDTSIEAHLGNLKRRQWKFDEAREHYHRALDVIVPLPMIQGRDEWLQRQMLGELASIESLSGHLTAAIAWNDKALELARGSHNTKAEASLLDDRGEIYMRNSRFSEAEKAYTDSVAVAETTGDAFLQASAYSSLGSLYFFRGDLGKAATTLEKSLALFRNAHAPEAEIGTWIMLSEVYTSSDIPDTAQDALKRARELAEKTDWKLAKELLEPAAAVEGAVSGKTSLTATRAQEIFGKFWEMPDVQDLMLPEDMQVLLREAIGIAVKPGTPVGAVDPEKVRKGQYPMLADMASMLRGKQLLQNSDTAGARALWSRITSDPNGNKDLRAGFLAGIGATYWLERKQDEAVHYFDKAVQAVGVVADDVKVEEMLAGYLGGNRRWYFDMAIDSLVRQRRFEEAFDHSERARARAFLQSLGNARLKATQGADPVLVDEAEALRKSIANWERQAAFEPRTVAEDLRNARERYATVLKRVKISNPEYASLTTITPLKAADVQRELPPVTTLISFFVATNGIHAWLIDNKGLRYAGLPATNAQLDAIVCWATKLGADTGAASRAMQPVQGKCSAAASPEQAYSLLFAPLRSEIRTKSLIIVPNGVLHYVPFGALRDPKTNRYLIEDYTISYVPSASTLPFLRNKQSPNDGRALVIGNPAAGKGSRLAGAEREAKTIAQLFGTTPKVGGDATKELLRDLDGKYDLVHICAHAVYDGEHPLFSHIVLAADGRQSGNLDVNDILSDVDLSGVNLVVLSACGTARGTPSGGDEIVGLTRAMLYAGTPAVTSTLWDVDDDAAADLMEDFYGHLREGAPVAEALRHAQLAMMKRAPYADPHYWAAFELNGDPAGQWRAAFNAAVARHAER